MNTFELQDFNKRIGLNTDLKNISEQICNKYNLGNFVSNELITIGYEDYNYYLTTSKGKYCVKIFNKFRTNEDINNYLNRIRVVANSNINAPKPLLVDGDISLSLDYENNHYDICVFEYINGKNFFELKQKTSKYEIEELARQTAMINNLDIKPNFIYDTWAIINFEEEYKQKRIYLEKYYQKEFEALGAKVLLTTADGSAGIEGFVTAAIPAAGEYTYTYACGPEPMLKAVYNASATDGEYSFEERMGCGFGACMGCSCKTKYGSKRICRDGPVLTKEEIIW